MTGRALRVVCVLLFLLAPGLVFALDREAFTITNYNLDIRVESDQQRLGVRGKITLRNDSNAPKKNLSLQISSTLDWRSIQSGGKTVQFISQPYTSDIDHTGALSEAVVTLPQAVAPKNTVELEIGYEGTIPLDATRLTRIGVPEKVAKHSDWDQIGKLFSAVRGVGYVVWYPVATESANLSEGDSVFEALGRWKAKEAQTTFRANLCTTDAYALMNDSPKGALGAVGKPASGDSLVCVEHAFQPLEYIVPAFAMGDYVALSRPSVDIYYSPENRSAADDYALAVELALPFVTDWFGTPREKAEVVDLMDAEASPYETGRMLFTPLGAGNSALTATTAVHQLTHAAVPSPRPWIYEGVAHFAQARERERIDGRQAGLDFMEVHRAAIIQAEKASAGSGANAAVDESLINTSNEEFYRSKAMYVWWMLRDMVGEAALKKALGAYRPEEDKDSSYVQKLVAAQSQKDLEWFFDDWVYRDCGLPDLKVETVYPRATMNGRVIVTITVENLGNAGAEVPVTLRFEGGQVTQRIVVPAKGKGVIRLTAENTPQEVVVNDGSVLESDMSNNIFDMTAGK